MLKAKKFIRICLAVMLLFLICNGDSVAKDDCDGGYGNSGPTVPEDFTPLPDPGPATMVVVNIGNQYMVWDPVQNRYASILSADNSQYITFPCSSEALIHWYNGTRQLSSRNLFSISLAGEKSDYQINQCDYGTCGSCTSSDSEASALTSCGTQWMPGSIECDWEEPAIEDRALHIQAQLNVFPNADAVDPTSLSRNSAFEQALVTLLNRYNSINGIGNKEIGATSFTINFRQSL